MSVTFCGHGDIVYDDKVKQDLIFEITKQIENGETEFLLGGYGNFDILAAKLVKAVKEKYPNIRSILVLPYLDRKYDLNLYDDTIYPALENIPKRFAILKRNEYMVDTSSTIIAYVLHSWGGAAKTLNYAVKKNKAIINIAKK